MKKLITPLLLLFIGANLMAQDVEIPANIKFETAADYKANEKLVLESIDWIQNTPITTNPAKRKEISSFLVKWMTGTPTVSLDLVPGLAPMECEQCLIAYMGGWTKYSLQHNSTDKLAGAMAGAESAIAFYKKNKGSLAKSTDIEMMIDLQNKGKLRKYVEDKLGN